MLPNFVMNRTASIVFTVLLIEVFRLKEMCTLWQYEESDRLYLIFWIVEDLRKEKCSSICVDRRMGQIGFVCSCICIFSTVESYTSLIDEFRLGAWRKCKLWYWNIRFGNVADMFLLCPFGFLGMHQEQFQLLKTSTNYWIIPARNYFRALFLINRTSPK